MRTRSESGPSMTRVERRPARSARTPSVFRRSTAAATSAGSHPDTGLLYGLGAPPTRCASTSAQRASNLDGNCAALRARDGPRGPVARARSRSGPWPARPALERAVALGRGRRLERDAPRVRRDRAAAHPPVDAELLQVAPLERELLVDQLEAARARLGDEARAVGGALLDGAELDALRAVDAVEAVGVGDEWPDALGR